MRILIDRGLWIPRQKIMGLLPSFEKEKIATGRNENKSPYKRKKENRKRRRCGDISRRFNRGR